MSRHRNIRGAPVAVALASAITAARSRRHRPDAGRGTCGAHDQRHGQRAGRAQAFDKTSNASIKKAVAAASAKAIPLAISNGRTPR